MSLTWSLSCPALSLHLEQYFGIPTENGPRGKIRLKVLLSRTSWHFERKTLWVGESRPLGCNNTLDSLVCHQAAAFPSFQTFDWGSQSDFLATKTIYAFIWSFKTHNMISSFRKIVKSPTSSNYFIRLKFYSVERWVLNESCMFQTFPL